MPAPPTCVPTADSLDVERIAQRLTYQRNPQESSAFAYEFACVDQETIILHDPRLLADVPPNNLEASAAAPSSSSGSRGLSRYGDGRIPSIDLSGHAYYMTQASQLQAHERLEALGLESPLRTPPTRLVAGHPLTERTRREIAVRLATAHETRTAANFSRCTVPLVFFSMWRNVSHGTPSCGPRARGTRTRGTRTRGTRALGTRSTSLIGRAALGTRLRTRLTL